MQDYDDRLDKTVDRTLKVTMTCTAHPTKLWVTKNIPGRTMFYIGDMAHNHGTDICSIRNVVLDEILVQHGFELEECYAKSTVDPCNGHFVLLSEWEETRHQFRQSTSFDGCADLVMSDLGITNKVCGEKKDNPIHKD